MARHGDGFNPSTAAEAALPCAWGITSSLRGLWWGLGRIKAVCPERRAGHRHCPTHSVLGASLSQYSWVIINAARAEGPPCNLVHVALGRCLWANEQPKNKGAYKLGAHSLAALFPSSPAACLCLGRGPRLAEAEGRKSSLVLRSHPQVLQKNSAELRCGHAPLGEQDPSLGSRARLWVAPSRVMCLLLRKVPAQEPHGPWG